MSLLRVGEEAVSRGDGYRRGARKPKARSKSDALKRSRDIFQRKRNVCYLVYFQRASPEGNDFSKEIGWHYAYTPCPVGVYPHVY